MPKSKIQFIYIWTDSTGNLRRSNFFDFEAKVQRFDGQATGQRGSCDDMFLVPVKEYATSYESGDVIVLCEVHDADGTPLFSPRTHLRKFLSNNEDLAASLHLAFEQEFMMIDPITRQPYMWPEGKNDEGEWTTLFPSAQGRYFGGMGDFVRGKSIMEYFRFQCDGYNVGLKHFAPSICLSQWSYSTSENTILEACDDLIFTRYLMEDVMEDISPNEKRCVLSLSPKSFPNTDWNGSGCFFRLFFDKYNKSNGSYDIAKEICQLIGEDHAEHMAGYGIGNEHRLTPQSRTSDYNKFTWGIGNRANSICIPATYHDSPEDSMYIEDRRPAANVNPYLGVLALCRTLLRLENMNIGSETVNNMQT